MKNAADALCTYSVWSMRKCWNLKVLLLITILVLTFKVVLTKENSDLNYEESIPGNDVVKEHEISTTTDKTFCSDTVSSKIQLWAVQWDQNIESILHFFMLEPLAIGDNKMFVSLVETIYAKTNQSDEVLQFARKLPFEYQISIYHILYNKMRYLGRLDRSDLIAFAYQVEKVNRYCINNGNYLHLMMDIRNVTNMFPKSIRALFSNNYLTVENVQFDGYTLYGSVYGNVYIYPDNNYNGYGNQKWTVSPVENGHYFTFTNKENGLSLYADGVNVYSKTDPGIEGHWELSPRENGQYFYIQSRTNHLVLDSNRLVGCFSSSSSYCGTAYLHNYIAYHPYQLWKIY